LETIEIVKEIESRKITGDLSKKRVVCARCGSTWIELIRLIVVEKEGSEDFCLHIGYGIKKFQTCRFRPLERPKCGSKDVYEVKVAEKVSGGGTAYEF
jgi:hypothetical protein